MFLVKTATERRTNWKEDDAKLGIGACPASCSSSATGLPAASKFYICESCWSMTVLLK